MDDCPICCDKYTNIKRAKVDCARCNASACKQCYQTFLVNETQPCCMHCKSPWDREFVDRNFPLTFRNGPMKRHREDVLIAIEEAMLPATQIYARLERQRRQTVDKRAALATQIDAAVAAVREAYVKCTSVNLASITYPDPVAIAAARREREVAVTTLNQLYSSRQKYTMRLRRIAYMLQTLDRQGQGAGDQEHRSFIKKCPMEGCNGFLSTQYKCGICKGKVCTKCLEPLHATTSQDAEGNDQAGHVCNPDTVASVEFLLTDTRPCPKCATPIHKIDGCDQMWCTQCQTAFSWRTGKVETGRIHNPHWYEWQRRVNNGNIPREPGDVPGGDPCLHANNDADIPFIDAIPFYKITAELEHIHRIITHVRYTVLPRYQIGGYQEDRNRDLRIKFLLGEIDREAWKHLLYAREKKRDKDVAIRQALEVFVHAASDIFWRLARDELFTHLDAAPELHALREYCNECLIGICGRFNSKQKLGIDEKWNVKA